MEKTKINGEKTKINGDCSPVHFFDAVFELPSFDLSDLTESAEESVNSSPDSRFKPVQNGSIDAIHITYSPEISFPSNLRRRPSIRCSRENPGTDSSLVSEIGEVCETLTPRERRNKILSAIKDHKKVYERSDSLKSNSDQVSPKSVQNYENNTSIDESLAADSNFLVFMAGLVIKAIVFQIVVLIKFFTLPLWLSYCSYKFLTDPFQIVRRAKKRANEKISRIGGVFCERMKGDRSIGKHVLRVGWGFFWSVYVCVVLFGFLVSAFVVGGIVMRYIVEEPVRIEETLNFDYTKVSPVSHVPVMNCYGIDCGVGCREKVVVENHGASRLIPYNHKLQLVVSLTLPESDYNRKLGVFQVRVEFLNANGKITATSSHPCMLMFKSTPIRYVETFLKTAPVLTGYSSESQILDIKMTGFTEGIDPTNCLKVVLEPRAEYKHGAGIPEIYAALLTLESELPLFKRIIWNWKKTIFIWTSMWLFLMELLLILVCCRPVIIPRPRPRDGSNCRK